MYAGGGSSDMSGIRPVSRNSHVNNRWLPTPSVVFSRKYFMIAVSDKTNISKSISIATDKQLNIFKYIWQRRPCHDIGY
jgi:hypothetical protein